MLSFPNGSNGRTEAILVFGAGPDRPRLIGVIVGADMLAGVAGERLQVLTRLNGLAGGLGCCNAGSRTDTYLLREGRLWHVHSEEWRNNDVSNVHSP